MKVVLSVLTTAWALCFALALTEEQPEACVSGSNEQCLAAAREARTLGNAQEEGTRLLEVEDLELEFAAVAKGRVAIILVMLGTVVAWMILICKFACDGSLPARLALWGFLPEAYSAISVSAVIALLRLKDGPLPVILLQQCVNDDNALQLAEAIRKYRKKAELAVLEVPRNPNLTLRGLAELVAVVMEAESEITELDFSYNPQFGDECVTTLMPLLAMKSKVTTLKIAECGMQEKGLMALANAAKKSRITNLDLSYNSFGGATEAVAAILEAPTMLTELKLDCCDLTLADIKAIAAELPHTSIETLGLGGNSLGSEGLVALSAGLPNSLVKELGLEANDIEASCPGVGALAAAWVKRPFARVRFAGNKMSEQDVADYIQTLRTLL
mmetsp:Transcript_18217/g.42411  ORF Transcript_18217/g.42411 Transcript_18217/m.42411 type:complete len:386 (+) Transcript_18217:93-1250(+)